MYTVNVHADMDKPTVNRWCHGWMKYVKDRLNFVEIPKSTWNLKLVNVQRITTKYKWEDEKKINLSECIPETDAPT